ncbi:hypothetical protein ACEN30_09570, partial [Marinilactibacillus psychrotolerans]|uniref:hypothetical protein n=1 Tax=Marinilactibacillus psychrotolerans TaxID=191770 RepID=UPI003886D001
EPCSSDSCLDPIKNRRPLHIWLILLCSVFKDLLLYKMSLRLSATFISYHVVDSVSTTFSTFISSMSSQINVGSVNLLDL